MLSKTVVGIFLCVVLFIAGFLIHGNLSLYFNISGLLVVIGGTSAAALLSFKWQQLAIAAKVVQSSYSHRQRTEREIIEILIDLSVKTRMEGILSLQEDEQETSTLFLRRALGCLVDGYRADQIRDILVTEMYYFKARRNEIERIIRTIAEYFPTFGIIGSVVGLITMLNGIGDTGIILKTVPIALTSTLYGLIFANFFFLPFAAGLRERTTKELLLQKIITEGILAIESEINPVILKTRLDSFLTPSERLEKFVSYKKIQESFNIEEGHVPPFDPSIDPDNSDEVGAEIKIEA